MAFKTSILSLPFHILEDITTGIKLKKSLRLLRGTSGDFIKFLSEFATGTSKSHLYTKSLTIRDIYPPDREKRFQFIPGSFMGYEKEDDWDVIQDLLPIAISAFKNVVSVKWYIREFDTESWIPTMVINGLCNLPQIQNLDVYMEGGSNWHPVNLASIPPLQELTLRTWTFYRIPSDSMILGLSELIAKSSKNLIKLTFLSYNDAFGPRDISSLDIIPDFPILQIRELSLNGYVITQNSTLIPHLRSLTSLSITDSQHPRPNFDPWNDRLPILDDVWIALKREKIHLSIISVDTPTSSLIHYIKSYTGLKSLSLTTPKRDSSSISKEFYNVLESQSASLETLEIKPHFEGEWCYEEHNSHVFLSLINLTHLSVCAIADPYYRPITITDEEMNAELEALIREETGESRLDLYNFSVKPLIEMASMLPKLQVLTILSADLRENEGNWCGTDRRKHAVPVSELIQQQVTTIGPLNPVEYQFNIVNGRRRYTVQQDAGGKYWYRDCISSEDKELVTEDHSACNPKFCRNAWYN
ncbi:hypothetical protein BDQ17DRAFT_1548253 [Cyathus striatus]|nr:hypothetical protein BDQ17DRAFT_1548253 [Cyathus striatus]